MRSWSRGDIRRARLQAWRPARPFDVRQYLNGAEPPMLVMQANKDFVAPEFESADFVRELKEAGDTVTYLQVPRRDHFSVLKDMTNGAGDPVFEAVLQFVSR